MQDLTTGSVSRHLLRTTGFMLVTMLFQTLYFLVDLYWVGRLGKEAVAGVSVAGNVTFLVLAITQMLGVGTTTLVSHAAGRKDRDGALLAFNQGLVLSVVLATLYLVLMTSIRSVYARSLAADPVTARLAVEYLRWFIPATALQFALVTMGAALRGVGLFKPGMIVQTVTVVLNMVLAPFLIFGWVTHRPMGVQGAALATLIAVAVGAVWIVFFFLPRNAFLKFLPRDWKPRLDLWASTLRIGLPAGVEFALVGVYLFMVYTVTRPFGAAAQAGFGIGLRIVQAGFMPVVALGFSVAPVAGQNFGARRADRVRETFGTAVRLAVIAMVGFTLVSLFAGGAMIRVFSRDPQVIAVGDQYLKIVAWTYPMSGIIFVCSSMFQAMGNTLPSMLASFTRIVLLAIAVLIVSRLPGFRLTTIWYLSLASVTLQVAMALTLLQREFHRRLRFETAPGPGPDASTELAAIGAEGTAGEPVPEGTSD
jgi:putative MATE family efflux protein